ncbi:MAG: hypothetical protein KGI27_07390 [Thaumarchaeota archaeon]|nr:hypothetical protein [Nitrososphaerota archaeon]
MTCKKIIKTGYVLIKISARGYEDYHRLLKTIRRGPIADIQRLPLKILLGRMFYKVCKATLIWQ